MEQIENWNRIWCLKVGAVIKPQKYVTLGLKLSRHRKNLDETVKLKGPGEKFSGTLKDLKKPVSGIMKKSKEHIIRRIRKEDPSM